MKKKNTYSKHDLRRAIEDLYSNTQHIMQRLMTFETLFNEYIALEDNEVRFREFLDKKYAVKPDTIPEVDNKVKNQKKT
tara:strand:- start:162 stop:398 length:237 start_codon:yes stop_codon:yes gene_type:complete